MKDRKIIQISNSAKQLYALCDDGSVWAFAPHNPRDRSDPMSALWTWERVSTDWVENEEDASRAAFHQG